MLDSSCRNLSRSSASPRGFFPKSLHARSDPFPRQIGAKDLMHAPILVLVFDLIPAQFHIPVAAPVDVPHVLGIRIANTAVADGEVADPFTARVEVLMKHHVRRREHGVRRARHESLLDSDPGLYRESIISLLRNAEKREL